MNFLTRIVQGLLLAAALSTTAAYAQPTEKQFFKPHTAATIKAGGAVKAPGVISDAVPIEFNAVQMLALVPGEEIQLTLPNATTRAVVFELRQDHGGGIYSWVGHLRGRGSDNRVILTTGPAGSYGVIDTPDGSYRVVPGDGHDWLVDMTAEQMHLPIIFLGDDALFPPFQPKSSTEPAVEPIFHEAIPGVNRVGLGKATPPLVNIDLMVVATKGLAERLGAGLLTRLNFLVTRANTSYADSEVGINLRLVNVTVVDYSDATSDSVALNAISPGTGSFNAATFGQVETIRTLVKADMVALLRNGSSFGGSGVAWVGSLSPSASFMYSVTTGCVAGCESVFIHEVGHNMGNMHDRATVAFQAGGRPDYETCQFVTQADAGCPHRGAFSYSYGYAFCKSGVLTCDPTLANGAVGGCGSNQPECSTQDASNFSDIMAYFQGSTQTIYKFSNPNPDPERSCATSNGDGVPRPCGISESAVGNTLTTGSSNTAKSMNETRTAISTIKLEATNPAGIIQFTNTAFSGSETGGSVAFTVSRSNGSGGAVAVSYSFDSGSATAGTDFTAVDGTLNWADNDAANKTITVPVANDGEAEGIESFTVTLSSPTGSATLGHPATAVGLILEQWPPGGTAPTGFSSPTTPARPWAVASDSYDGTLDTVSFKSAAFADNDTGNSSTQYADTFQAGTVAFAFRVSSYPGNGFFEFLIDNVVVLSDSGDTGEWKFFSTNVAAGFHTLEWRYRKTLNFACRLAKPVGSPDPPPFPNCQDRAWIDTISLPPKQTGQFFALDVSKSGSGTVASSPAGIDCGATCTANFLSGTVVTLTATPGVGSVFSGWAGACSGTGACNVTMDAAKGLAATFSVSPNAGRLINIATRGKVGTEANVLIAGFIIGGDKPKKVLVTARGPSVAVLPSEVPLLMADPSMVLYSGANPIDSNDDWQQKGNFEEIPLTMRPGNAKDSAILTTLAPGAYTAIVSGVNSTEGLAIVEVFEVDSPEVPLINIATRGRVGTGANVLIAGFIIQGETPKTVLVTARGQSTAVLPSEVPLLLPDPVMKIYSGASVIYENDDWEGNTITAVGWSAPLPSSSIPLTQRPGHQLDSAVLVTLPPGAYTAIVSGFNNAEGIGIVEVFAQ